MHLFEISPFVSALSIFGLRLTDVSLGTVRMIMIIRGRPAVAALIGFVEVSIFIVAISQVITHLNNWLNVIGYSSGFACGTYLGIQIERRITPAFTHVRVISTKLGRQLAHALRGAGFGVTEMQGQGANGRVDIITTLVKRADIPETMEIIEQTDRDAFITVDEPRMRYRGFFRTKKK